MPGLAIFGKSLEENRMEKRLVGRLSSGGNPVFTPESTEIAPYGNRLEVKHMVPRVRGRKTGGEFKINELRLLEVPNYGS